MKTLLILGSNSDVGQACAHKFAQMGFRIILASRNPDGYQKRLSQDLSIRYKIECKTIFFEAAETHNHITFFNNLSSKPDVVLSTFGYLGIHEKAIIDFNHANEILVSNLTGNISILGIIANYMEKQKQGAIICISSVAGERGRKGNYIYGSAKAGLTAFLSGLRARLSSSNVHVLTVIPGFIKTKMLEIQTPSIITTKPANIAESIWYAYQNKKNIIYTKPIWKLIMFIIKIIPERMFKKMNL